MGGVSASDLRGKNGEVLRNNVGGEMKKISDQLTEMMVSRPSRKIKLAKPTVDDSTE